MVRQAGPPRPARAARRPLKARAGRPTAADAIKREAAILEQATASFLQDGYAATSIEAIAKAQSAAKRTIYARWSGKPALFRAVAEHLIARWLAHSGVWDDPPDLEAALREAAERIMTVALTPEAIALNRLMIAESARFPELPRMMHEAGADAIEPDSWDAWNSDRDQALTAAAGGATSATKSMPDSANPAWGDLNQSGNWYNVPDEGYVWSPYEASDSSWDPFGNGYWMNTPGFGYTWVSGYSWGFLPFQCGLWNWYGGFGWGWAPGACTPWWGGGGVWITNVGRFPIGWHPPFRPIRPHGPGRPRPGGGILAAGPQPLIAVRRQGPPVDGTLPLRDRRTPVTIAGATVTPLRPVNVRPVYNHQPARMPMMYGGAAPGSSPGSTPGSPSPGSTPGTARPAFGSGPAGASHARPAPGGIKSAPAPHAAPRAAPAPAPRAAPPPPSRPR